MPIPQREGGEALAEAFHQRLEGIDKGREPSIGNTGGDHLQTLRMADKPESGSGDDAEVGLSEEPIEIGAGGH